MCWMEALPVDRVVAPKENTPPDASMLPALLPCASDEDQGALAAARDPAFGDSCLADRGDDSAATRRASCSEGRSGMGPDSGKCSTTDGATKYSNCACGHEETPASQRQLQNLA